MAGEKFMCHCIVFASFYFVFEGKFPPESYIRTGDLTDGLLCYESEGLIHEGAYLRNFTVLPSLVA